MLTAVLSGFALAFLAPLIVRCLARRAGWFLALLPGFLTFYFLKALPHLPSGPGRMEHASWIPGLGIDLAFHLDGLSALFALLISGIGTLIVIYSGGYLSGRLDIGRFYAFLFLFMSSMLGLVLSDNLILLFIFWELTSISSYFLIGFDHTRKEARSAALQALLVTAAGGLVLLAGLLLLAQAGGSFQISTLLTRGDILRAHPLYVPILMLVLVGAFTKSAQFPFHFWLPNAMQAPTPVSAYLHSSTMVKAGIYLLARLTPALGGSDVWRMTLVAVGGMTLFAASVILVRKTAFKSLLAYSTISALGFLTVLLGLGTASATSAAVTFLLAHAVYKGALFLTAGSVDHGTGEKNTERLGGLASVMPLTAAAGVLSALSMAGFPFLMGFVAKEKVYAAAWEGAVLPVFLTGLFIFAGAFFMFAAWFTGVRPFLGRPIYTTQKSHDVSMNLWLGPVSLALLGCFLGFAPQRVDPLLSWAAASILGVPVHLHLAPWHDPSILLVFSAATLVCGGIVIWKKDFIRRILMRLEGIYQCGPERIYGWGLELLNRIAKIQTRVLQSGYLRQYLFTILTVTVGLVGFVFLSRVPTALSLAVGDMTPYEGGLCVLIVLAALSTVRSKSRFRAVAALGVVGYAVALLFLHLGAPDLAMTQLVVDTITVILFVLVLYHLPRFSIYTSRSGRLRDGILSLAAGILMTALVLCVLKLPLDLSLSEYFAANSLPLAHGRNIVNVILVDFRGLDTLGEISVLVIAGLGIYGMLKLRSTGKR